MAVVSSIFFVLAFILAVAIGPQTRAWSWGPALIPLGIAVLAALPGCWKTKRLSDPVFVISGLLATLWFAGRAWISPVHELAVADLLLLAGAVGSFLVMRSIADSPAALRIFTWGVALWLLANVVVIGLQVKDPAFNPVFATKSQLFPSGFFAHYNEAANFLIGTSLLLAGAALFGRHATPTRIAWGLISAGGLVAVYFTRSRGAILATGVGLFGFFVLTLMVGKRKKARWFVPLLLGLPVLLLIAGGLVFYGWNQAQQARGAADISSLMDNSIRLYLMGLATSCVQLHPIFGGGSRSFSWECFQFWGWQDNGWTGARPEQVHNEFLQAITDYGAVAGVLLVMVLVTLAIHLLLRTIDPDGSRRHPQADAMSIGGLAAIVGMLVQSSFSFVFHLMPGAILLGICLGRASVPFETEKSPKTTLALKICLSAVVLLLAGFVFPYGLKGTQVTRTLWQSYFGKPGQRTSQERIDALAQAVKIWPQASLYKDRGILLQKIAATEPANRAVIDAAIADYQAGIQLHPYEPTISVNLANLLSLSGKDPEARGEYERAVKLQGGLELGFRAHFGYATHLLKTGFNQLNSGEPEKALATYSQAKTQIEASVRESPLFGGLAAPPANSINDGIGRSQEAMGDLEGALKTYNEFGGVTGNYRAAVILTYLARSARAERKPSEALAYLQEARARVSAATELPPDITQANKAQLIGDLDESIAFLVGARIEPAKKAGR